MPYSAEDELRTGKILRVSATAPRFRSATMSSGSGPAWAMSSPVGEASRLPPIPVGEP
ncbi:Uncharacterised protein [Mycobacteroides abscessus subsp. abscessus]|nr:Uncharacterised protein [Mycobacteroides abscessus subsp. abscessus]